MAEKAYTLKKSNTNVYHLFEGTMYPPDSEYDCTYKDNSICEKMIASESIEDIFSCFTEDQAREKCAYIGRKVCGICVSHLYETG
jgi:hypothetical protein